MNLTSLRNAERKAMCFGNSRAHTVTDRPALSAPACRTTEGRTEHKQHIKEPEEKTVSHASASLCHHSLEPRIIRIKWLFKGNHSLMSFFILFPSLLSLSPMLVCQQIPPALACLPIPSALSLT